jgi:hypothetical protein
MSDNRYYLRSKDDLNVLNNQQQIQNTGTLSTGRTFGLNNGLQSPYQGNALTNNLIQNNSLSRPTIPPGFQYNTYSISNTNRPIVGNNAYSEQANLLECFLKDGSGADAIMNKLKTNNFEEKTNTSDTTSVHLNCITNLIGEHLTMEEIRYLDKKNGRRPSTNNIQSYVSGYGSNYNNGLSQAMGGNNVNNPINNGMSVNTTNNNGLMNGFQSRFNNPLSSTSNPVANPLTPQFQNRFATLNNPQGNLNNGLISNNQNQTMSNNISLPFPQVGNGMIQNSLTSPSNALQTGFNTNTGLNTNPRPPFGLNNNLLNQNNTLQTNNIQNPTLQLNPLQNNNLQLGSTFPPKLNSPLGNSNLNNNNLLGNNVSSFGQGFLGQNNNLLNTNNTLNNSFLNNIGGDNNGLLNNNTTNMLINKPNTGGIGTTFNNPLVSNSYPSNTLQNNFLPNSNQTIRPLGFQAQPILSNPLQSFGTNSLSMNTYSNNNLLMGQNNLSFGTNNLSQGFGLGLGMGTGSGLGNNSLIGNNSIGMNKPFEIKHGNILGFNLDTLQDPKTLSLTFNTNINPQPSMSILDKVTIGPKSNYLQGNNNFTFNTNILGTSTKENNMSQILMTTSKDPYGITERSEEVLRTIEKSKPRDLIKNTSSSADKNYFTNFKPLSNTISFNNKNDVVFKTGGKLSGGLTNKTYMKPLQLSVIKEANNSGKKSHYTDINSAKFDNFKHKTVKDELKGVDSILKLKVRKPTNIESHKTEFKAIKTHIEGLLNLKIELPEMKKSFNITIAKQQTGEFLKKAIREELSAKFQIDIDTEDIVVMSKEKPVGDKHILGDDLFITDGLVVYLNRPNYEDNYSSNEMDILDVSDSVDYCPVTKKFRTIPSIEQLKKMKHLDLKRVKDFQVYNEFGVITFKDETDVTELNLDEIIVLEHRCFSVYNNGNVPEFGKKLNKPAEVKLFNIIDEEIEYSEEEYRARKEAFEERIKINGNARLLVFDWTENYIIIEVENFNNKINN